MPAGFVLVTDQGCYMKVIVIDETDCENIFILDIEFRIEYVKLRILASPNYNFTHDKRAHIKNGDEEQGLNIQPS